jgi:hypothetical protein
MARGGVGLTCVLDQCKTRIDELERDVEYKEAERHRACRDYDRLTAYVNQQGGVHTDGVEDGAVKVEKKVDGDCSGEKAAASVEMVKREELAKKEEEHAKQVASLRETMASLDQKIYQERHKHEAMKRELVKFKALEKAVRGKSLKR